MNYINDLCERRKNLECIKPEIVAAFDSIKNCYKKGNKVLVCGNGGSSADSSHIVGELLKGFKKSRTIDEDYEKKLYKTVEDYYDKNLKLNARDKVAEMKKTLEQGLPTIDLTSIIGHNTAFANDKNAEYVFANAVLGLGKDGDVLLAITTSGNSENIIDAALVAKAKGIKVIALTGKGGGKIKDIADINIIVPLDETYLIQEEHIAIYHAICLDIEEVFF